MAITPTLLITVPALLFSQRTEAFHDLSPCTGIHASGRSELRRLLGIDHRSLYRDPFHGNSIRCWRVRSLSDFHRQLDATFYSPVVHDGPSRYGDHFFQAMGRNALVRIPRLDFI
jgi:hypothetical protein